MKRFISIFKKCIPAIFIVLRSPLANAQCINVFPHTEGFEAAPTWTSGGANNDWAWGTPAHPTINTAGGGVKSWCVGGLTGSFYAYSEQCWIQSPCYNFSTLSYPWVSFKIFWECEHTWDGMVLQYSINSGATWINVGAYGDPVDCNTANWFNYGNINWLTSITTKNGWSGRIGATVGTCAGGSGSGGWKTATHCLTGLAGQSNVIFRFLMGSGTTCNSYDGMAIDDFTISDGMPHAPNFSVTCVGTTFNFTAINPACPVVSTYTWNFGDPASGPANTSTVANPSHAFSAPGTYSVTLSVAGGGCNPPASITQTITVSNFTTPAVSQSVTCFGGSNGSGTVNVAGNGPFSYTWSPTGGNATTASGLPAGTYSVLIRDANNCSSTTTLSVIQPPALNGTITHSNVTCNGQSNGSATVTASGGTPGYTYSWSPSGGTASTATGLGAGTYTVTIIDANNCVTTATTTIIQPPLLTAAVSSGSVLCNGGSTGSATITASGGVPAYTYTWSPSGGNAATATALVAGTYSVIVKDASNCTVTAIVNITQPPAITLTLNSTNASCGNSNGSATVAPSGGTGPYTYNWSPSGGTGGTASGLPAGNYSVAVTDAHGCPQVGSVVISSSGGLTVTATATNVACNGGNTGIISSSVTGGTPAYTYTWSPSGGNSSTAMSLTAGIYTVTVKDANNCVATTTATITQPPLLTAAVSSGSVLCNGGATGSATVIVSGGTPGYTYTWSPGGGNASTASSLAAGTYSVIIKDANSCTVTAVTTIAQPPAITLSSGSSNATCGNSNGSATVTPSGGTGPYTYNWSPSGGTGNVASGLNAGIYVVTITDANACTKAGTITVSSIGGSTVTTAATSVSCNGGSNGTISSTITGGTGPYTYTWLPTGGNSGTATSLTAGTYSVIVKDASNCLSIASATIIQPSLLTAAISSSSVLCNGQSNGSATVTASGGTPGYTYSWSPVGGNMSTAASLPAGTYTVTVMDANSCASTATTTITQPSLLTAAISSGSVLCNGGATGSATVTASGGTPAYTYTWSPAGGNFATEPALTAGTYSVTVKDANGCTVTAVTTITQPSAITLSFSSAIATCGNANGAATVTPSGGTGPYTYHWLPSGSIANIASGLNAGNYSVIVSDANGCTRTGTVAVSSANGPGIATTATNVVCNGGSNGIIASTVTGGTPGFTYSWLPSGGAGSCATALPAGTYTVTVTDANGCMKSATATISEPSPVTLTITSSATGACAGSNINLSGTATGGTAPYSYSWTPGPVSSAQVVTEAAAGNYTYALTVSDQNGCNITQSIALDFFAQPAITVSSATICAGNVANLAASGATTYTWQPGNITGNTYTYTGTSSLAVSVSGSMNGCAGQATANVIVNPLPSVAIMSGVRPAGCAPVCTTFSCSTHAPVQSVAWNFGNGSTDTSIVAGSCFTLPGTYTVSAYLVDANGCTASSSYTLQVYPGPVADFNYAPYMPIENTEVQFTDASYGSNIIQWDWYLTDQASPHVMLQNPQYIYEQAGNYPVALVVTDDHGCKDTIVKSIQVGEDWGIWVPDAFTPNDDGLNDVFQAKGFGIVKYELRIFDRWGEQLVAIRDFSEGWNGFYKGELAKNDVYVWKINFTNVAGQSKEMVGHVTLMK